MLRKFSKLTYVIVLSLFMSSLGSQAVFAQAPSHDRQANPPIHVRGAASTAPVGYNPTQIRNAYGINSLSFNGAGQTVAIVDAYDDPTIFNDLSVFKSTFGISGCNVLRNSFFLQVRHCRIGYQRISGSPVY